MIRRLLSLLLGACALAAFVLPAQPAAAAGDDYPWRTSTSIDAVDTWGFTQRQCTSYVAWELAQRGTPMSNAGNRWGDGAGWDEAARVLGVTVTSTPKVGAVAHWNAFEKSTYYPATGTGWIQAGSYGHVAYVTAVYGDGSVRIEQYNMGSTRSFSTMRVKAPRYLYIADGPASAAVRRPAPTENDFNGDGRSDLAVWRPSDGTWFVRGVTTTPWGRQGDVPVAADYDGDGRTDVAVWRPSDGTWFVRGVLTATWGRSGDVAAVADYDGDGRADLAVWRPSDGTWHVRGVTATEWGVRGDVPAVGDYDGDGKADLAVYRPSKGVWYVRGISTVEWGVSGDKPVASDFDGDGRTELAVWRPSQGTWHVRGVATAPEWGTSRDRPVAADYDGDGATDVAVWRPSEGAWYVAGARTTRWGAAGDLPV